MPDIVSTVSAPAIRTDLIRALEEVEFLLDFVDKSDKRKQLYVPIWDEVTSNYFVNPFAQSGMALTYTRQGTALPSSMARLARRQNSVLKDPETHQIIESITSQALVLLLGALDPITAVPIGRDDPEKARLISRLLMSAMAAPGVWRTHYQLIKDAFLYGVSYLEIGWETRTRKQYVPIGDALVPDDVLYRDRPLQRALDPYDVFPDPSGTRIQEDMIGIAKRFRITAQEALRLARAGVYDMEPTREAIARAIDQRKKQSGTKYGDDHTRFSGEPQEIPWKMLPIGGLEYWGESPVTRSDNMSNRVITMLSGVNVRSRGNPFLDGNIPIKEVVVNPVQGRHVGLSPAEVIRFLQDSTDALLMAFTDLVTRAVKGPVLVGGSWGGNPQELREQQGFIHCADPDKVKPMPFEVNVLQFCAAEITRRKLTMREGTGATNPMQAIPSGARTTATEVSELVRLASQRVEPMVQLIEREDYPWVGRTLHSRFRQFMPDGGAVATLGNETFIVPLEAIDIDADVRFTGARQAGSKFQKFTQNRMAGELLGSEAGRQLILTAPELVVRMLRDGLDIVDAEDIVERAQKRAMMLMQIEMLRESEPQGQTSLPSPSREEQSGSEAGQTELQGQRIA